jgi:4-amino-4-deoxy-L-arabinose transferase-like glycosyltransferase
VGRDVSRRTAWAILAAIVVYALAMHVWFIDADRRPCNLNELSHIMGPIEFLNLASQSEGLYTAYLEAFNGYPPIGMVTSGFYAVLGRRHDSAVYSQLLFTTLLLIGIYGLGAQLLDRRTGLLAAWLLAVCPATVEVSRQYLLELPLTATSVAAVWLLLATDRFTNRPYSIAAGLAMGLAALAKQTFLLFLIGPLLYLIPGWLSAIKQGTPTPKKSSRMKLALRIALSVLVALAITWLLYRAPHRAAIENWFAAAPQYRLPYGSIFFAVTSVMLFFTFFLFSGRSTPRANAVAACLLAVFVASLWYFPKGVLNFVTYAHQMRMNENQAHMSPLSLLVFYKSQLEPYYFGAAPLYVFLVAVAMLAAFAVSRRWLRRSFYLHDLFPGPGPTLLMLVWFLLPFAAFFFINIQNEMNTVPLMPSLMLIVAAVIMRVRLPYSAKAQKSRQAGRTLVGARALHGLVLGFRWLLIASMVAWGVLSTTPWSDGQGGYQPLPGPLNREQLVQRLFARKIVSANYLVPEPDDWQESAIAHAMFSHLPDTNITQRAPRILSMDVDFYFSWNSFWYMAKLFNKRVEIRSAWDNDRDITSPASPDYYQSFDMILYRQPYKQVYNPDERKSDYIDYKNIWKDFALLDQRPPELATLFPIEQTWTLPDGSHAILLRRAASVR